MWFVIQPYLDHEVRLKALIRRLADALEEREWDYDDNCRSCEGGLTPTGPQHQEGCPLKALLEEAGRLAP